MLSIPSTYKMFSLEEENIGVTADTQEVEVKEEDMSSIDIDSEQEVEEFGKESK